MTRVFYLPEGRSRYALLVHRPLSALVSVGLVIASASCAGEILVADGGVDSNGSPSSASSAPDDSGSEQDASQPTEASAGDAGLGIVINEVSGKHEDYVEILNTSSATVDITYWGITDEDHKVGGPKVKHLEHFPAGSSLGPGQYAVVLAGKLADGGVEGRCPASFCIAANWNISNSKGETVYLFNSVSVLVDQATFPMEEVDAGQSWGRLPNGTGDFALNLQTPGRPNQAP